MTDNQPTPSIEKYIVNDKVAVLITPNYGAGWSTGNQEYPQILFDPKVVDMVLTDHDKFEMLDYLKATYPRGYFGDLRSLKVCWVDVDRQFVIHEYDGFESIRYFEDFNWITA